MPERLTVVEDDGTLHPRADVPSEWLWSLVDYLSLQRVAVQYEYHATKFRVTFQRLGARRRSGCWTNGPRRQNRRGGRARAIGGLAGAGVSARAGGGRSGAAGRGAVPWVG